MLRPAYIVWCFVFFQLAAASPANAWWEFIEAFSGPGPFVFGWDIETRLVCFAGVDPRTTRRTIAEIEKTAAILERLPFNLADSKTLEEVDEALKRWEAAIATYRRFASPVYLDNAATIEGLEATLSRARTAEAAGKKARAEWLAASKIVEEKTRDRTITSDDKMLVARHFGETIRQFTLASTDFEYVAQVVTTEGQHARANVLSTFGVLFSACSVTDERARRGSVDLGFHYLRTDGTPEFADNHEVILTMLTPSLSWRMFSFLDGGAGLGVYWFTSEGFQSFSGIMLEPFRMDLHAPSPPKTAGLWRSLASTPMVRGGMYWFPAGFDENAFARETQRRKAGESLWRAGVYIDVNPLKDYACRKLISLC